MALASSRDYTLLDIESLSKEDIDSLKMFSLIRRGNISWSIHVILVTFWNDRIHIESMYKLCRRIASLSQIKTIVYDCCINSCCAFIGTDFESAQSCPFCHEPRFDDRNCTRKYLMYYPAVMIAAWWGGFWPGVFATALSAGAAAYAYLRPAGALSLDEPGAAVSLALFTINCIV